MGKAAAPSSSSPVKKNATAAAATSKAVSVTGARPFDDALIAATPLDRVERVESTTVNRENATHVAFAASRKRDFVYASAPQYVRVLDDYCRTDGGDASLPLSSTVLVVVSQPGDGKSALLAHWADARRSSADGARELIFEHYAGCSYDSVRLALFLFRCMSQIKTTYALRDFELPREHDEEKLKFSFARCLEAAVGRTHQLAGTGAKPKRIILVLDGIDCIRNEDGGDSLSWLPTTFPANVRVVVSATQTTPRGTNHLCCCKWLARKPFAFDSDEDLVYDTSLPAQEHDSHTIRELRRRHSTFVVVEPLDEPACRAILQHYESRYTRALAADEKEAIVAAPGSSSPLYVRLLLHGLELFAPPLSVATADDARKQWLRAATHTNELHVVYELLMKQWNELLLADLYDQFHRCKAAADAAAHSSGVTQHGRLAASQSHSASSDAASRKLTRQNSKRSVTPDHTSANVSADAAATELETLQTAIEQRALLVRHALSLLAVARYGLSDSDLAKLLGDAVPPAVCEQLLQLLRPHLMQIERIDCCDGVSTLSSSFLPPPPPLVLLNDISHNQLRLIIRYGFLRDDHVRACYYRELATYFDALAPSQRRIDELPVQLERCGLWTHLQSALVDMRMFQRWWSARNRDELFAYWRVLRANGAVHDPVDDFVRSLDEHVARESPSAEHVLTLCLTITEFLRAWQRVDDDCVRTSYTATHNVAVHRPAPPQLAEFIAGLPGFSLAHASATDATRLAHDIDALAVHTDDGYYVRRWLWTQFPLLAVAFETRFLRNVLATRFASTTTATAAANGSDDTSNQQQNERSISNSSSSSGVVTVPPSSVVLPKALSATSKASPTTPTKRKLVATKTAVVLPVSSAAALGSTSSASADDDAGAFEFLSPERTEGSVGSVSKLETHVMDLRMRYDKLKFAAKEKRASLDALDARLADARAQMHATNQSASRIDVVLEQLRRVGDDTLVGKSRSEYYRAILRHCELHPARDANTIASAEAAVARLKADVQTLQQRTQVVAYERRLASIEVPKLQRVLQDKARMHAAALARLRWREALTHRLTARLLAAKQSTATGGIGGPSFDAAKKKKKGVASDNVNSDTASHSVSSDASAKAAANRRATSVEELSFLRAKDKLLHQHDTSAARQQHAASLRQYVGSAFKDDGILGALRHVGINRPEDAHSYWLDQREHTEQLEAEERRSEQRVSEYRDRLASLHAQLQSLQLGGSSSDAVGDVPEAASAGASVASASTSSSTAAPPTTRSESVGKTQSVKLLEQQLADATAGNQLKRERAARLKALSERLHLGLLHIAHILGVAAAARMDALALSDAIEHGVRLFLGDDSHHLQSSSSMNLRRKNSARVMGLAGHAGSHALVPLDARTAHDKARYNVRVTQRAQQPRVLNPYVATATATAAAQPERSGDCSDSEESDESDDRSSASGSAGVRRREDIKDHARLELQRKESEKKRAEKRQKSS